MSTTATTMKAARFLQQGGDLTLVDMPIPTPAKNQIRIKVVACGVCHSDVLGKYGFPGLSWPRTPGHEVAGVVEALGEGVTKFKIGEKVGVGWYGGHCASCSSCDEDEFILCSEGKVCGIHFDGGYAEYMVAPVDSVARIPDDLSFEQAGPLMCAGITVYNSIRNQNIKAGAIVAIQGIGGLGHLAIQFAKKLGFEVVAFSSGADKEKLARELGAKHYINGALPGAVDELAKLKPKLIVTTAPHTKSVQELIKAMALGGKLLILSALMEPLQVNSLELLSKKQSIAGWASGDNRDSEDTMKFAVNNNVFPMIETFPLEKAGQALQHTLDNKVRFRSVITINH
ncbi:hypothetical protein SAMD00019534_056830 [Acytostelium subglobosum LB1]|uniref:hypothetical protein n=1 Tax=Acytostelium subglobosum LB1 TaxID=1410327 RepID=UPI000644861C|nr:hypothetical protein SAMD00019534_056830 [Acytostelium subglobosum LB1]GAM22508.1 hypothetical protein SAMD00019534_056830 [Acytostelium subglobosum LB1]|eukprot:XP_012754628.1 hypothetical protein SAMD00019534_056830 [Acytostelium subglobosum LB1]